MEKTYLYRLFTSANELLYVGITKDLLTRLAAHRSWQPWWPDVDYYSIKEYKSRPDAELAEATAIFLEKPEHNQMPGINSSAEQKALEKPHRPKRHVALPADEAEYLASLNGDEAYSRAAELKRAGWSITAISQVVRTTPDMNSLRTHLRHRANAVTGIPVPVPPLSDEQLRQQRAVPRSYLDDSEKDLLKEYAKYSAKLRPQYTADHPVALKVQEYREFIIQLHHRGVYIDDIAAAAGRNRSSIKRLYKEGLEITQEEPRRRRPRK